MKILIDMNLSPQWVDLLIKAGYGAVHWSDVGPILATTQAASPSVVQLRTQDVHPDHLGALVLLVFTSFEQQLASGALISVDEVHQRVRILPIG